MMMSSNSSNTHGGEITKRRHRPRVGKSALLPHYNKALSASTSSLMSDMSSISATLSVAPSVCSASTVSTRSTSCSISTASSTQSATPLHFSETYEVVRQIGDKGAYSVVYEARNKITGHKVAVKVIRRSKLSALDDAAVFEEVDILRYLSRRQRNALERHKWRLIAQDFVSDKLAGFDPQGKVVELLDFYVTKNTFYIVTELMEQGDIFDQIVQRGRFSESDALDIITSLLQAVKNIHAAGIAHRDIKPENLLLWPKTEVPKDNSHDFDSCRGRRRRTKSHSPTRRNSDDSEESEKEVFERKLKPGRRKNRRNRVKYGVKLADFGLATRVHKSRSLLERCGTPMYVAPEVLRGSPYDQSCDLWSVGVILYFLLSGCPPFMDKRKRGLFFKILAGSYSFEGEGWESISVEAKDLISKLLTVDSSTRITAENALEHNWIRGVPFGESEVNGNIESENGNDEI